MTVRFTLLNESAVLPTYAHPGDAGMDLRSIEDVVIEPGKRALVKTGLAMELPEDAEAQVRPRSGLAIKNGITVLNSPGTIDSGYRGEVGVILINHGEEAFHVEKGMKIAQMVIAKVEHAKIEVVTELSSSDRGAGGFGSTGV
ncbi:MAG: dUTP diphosphatase [Kiritimatiellae bacterium]|nr:dUTP diphosphatase [Kiritimatiellia bacterium]